MGTVHVHDIALPDGLHQPRDRLASAKGMAEPFQEGAAVAVVGEDRLPVIAPLGNVMCLAKKDEG